MLALILKRDFSHLPFPPNSFVTCQAKMDRGRGRGCEGGGKHGALRPQKPLKLIRDGEVGGSGLFLYLTPTPVSYTHLTLPTMPDV